MDVSRTKNLVVIISGILIFFIGIILASFANFPGMYSYYSTTKYSAFLVSVCLSLLILAISFPSIKIRKDNISLVKLGCILLLLLAISIVFSSSVSNSVLGQYSQWEYNLLTYLGYGIILTGLATFFGVLEEQKMEKQVFSLMMVLVILVTVGYGIGEYYVWKPQTGYISDFVERISLGFRNPMFAAFFIGMLWIYSFTEILTKWLWSADVKPKKVVSRKEKFIEIASFTGNTLLFGLLTHLFMLTFTRTAWLMAGVSVVGVLIFLFLTGKKEPAKNITQTAGSFLVIVSLIGINIFLLRQPLSQRSENTFFDATQTLAVISRSVGGDKKSAEGFFQDAGKFSTAEIRIREWQWGLKAFISDWKVALIGSGPDALFFVLPKYRDAIFNNIPTDSFSRPNYLRNMYLTLLLMHGLVFFIVITILGGILALKVLKKFNLFDVDKKKHILPVIALVFGFLCQGVFYYPTFPILVLLVFAISYLTISMNLVNVSVVQSKLKVSTLMVLFILMLASWTGLNIYAERRLDDISLYWIPTKEVVAGSYDIPVNSNIFKRIYLYYFPDEKVSEGFLNELRHSNDLDDLRAVAATLYARGRRDSDNTKVQESIEILTKMTELDPTTPTHYDELGLRYLYLQQFDQSRKHFEKVLTLKNDFWFTYLHMGELLKQECKPQEAITWYEKAKPYVPQATEEIVKAQGEIINPPAYCPKK